MAKQVPARNGGTLTRPDKGETMNPDGRPPGSISFKAIAERLLDGKITIEQAGVLKQITRREKMILNVINDAVNDEDPNVRLRALAYIVERTEGKVADKVDLNLKTQTVEDGEFTPEQLDAIQAAITQGDGRTDAAHKIHTGKQGKRNP